MLSPTSFDEINFLMQYSFYDAWKYNIQELRLYDQLLAIDNVAPINLDGDFIRMPLPIRVLVFTFLSY
ncbi:hypothetical protein PEB0149_009750 [Bartonella apis]|uniref:Uncharacterized protein n=1 Tax=Bartonella apis TaxID=1686310 RepID=A0A1R0F9A1_9HYPH|nr:hypothetical protein PEB0149_009750 [Bartonella apis]